MPETTALRIVSAVWWIAIVVLMNAFAGQMRACLMVKSERPKLNTLVDIASKPQLKVYLLKNTVATRYLESSQGTAEKTVWGMIRRHNTDLYGLLRFSDEMMTEILQEKAVMIHADSISLAQCVEYAQFFFFVSSFSDCVLSECKLQCTERYPGKSGVDIKCKDNLCICEWTEFNTDSTTKTEPPYVDIGKNKNARGLRVEKALQHRKKGVR
ncbi:hypothetical protein HPB49_020876 [Dermacentor silvarum]|uniref:Uncharacterized protein n=1 Tax=Dermacentor silvarum TaxID=543639 RepID=A0ACB8CBA4_DERSI|nr:hypothetical protein HPB49_020876 [Dermacentor silvarum]